MQNQCKQETGVLIFDGKPYEVSCPVVRWDQPGGLKTELGHGARRRTKKIDKGINHWTGGEGDAAQVARTLHSRELGAEGIVDNTGTIFQTCDPFTHDTFDAGRWNPTSVGLEIVNYGFRRDRRRIPKAGRQRETYETRIRGRKRILARFYPAQLHAADQFWRALAEACPNLSLKLPREDDGSLVTRTLSPREARLFSGILGHYHLSKNKSDPGNDIFEYFDNTGEYL